VICTIEHTPTYMSIRLREIPAGCQELVAFNPASFIDALRTPGLDLTQHLRLDHIAVALHDRVCPAILKAFGVPGDIWTSSYERDFVSRSWTWHEGRSTQLSRW
jgi:hypothetical protein